MFIALVIIAKDLKQYKCLSVKINKMYYIHIIKYYSVIKSNNWKTWKEENDTCYKINKLKKCYTKCKKPDTRDYVRFHLHIISITGKFVDIESRSMGAWDGGRE